MSGTGFDMQGAASNCRLMVGIVTDTADSKGMGRVKVKFPLLQRRTEEVVTDWARIVAPMAGNDRGCYFPLENGDEVVVMLVGSPNPDVYVLGALWNGKDKPPADNRDGENNERVIKSRSGHVIRFNDTKGKESLEIVDGSGGNRIEIDMAGKAVTITSAGDIVLSATQGGITLAAQTIDINGTDGVKIQGRRVEIN